MARRLRLSRHHNPPEARTMKQLFAKFKKSPNTAVAAPAATAQANTEAADDGHLRPACAIPWGEEGLVPEKVIAQVRAHSRFDVLAATTVDRARWFAAFLVLGGITFFSAFGWYVANQRFAENVRVAWVKLDPSGAYTVSFADDERPVEFFQATLESKMTEFVEKRYRRSMATILADYRYTGYYLSQALTTQFLSKQDYDAPRVAAELIACKGGNCLERDVKVRVVQHRTAIDAHIPDKREVKMYETQVFLTFTDRKLLGTVVERRNAIVQVGWRIRTKGEIVANKAALPFNPLGIEILSLELKEDPTPVPLDAST
jgi:hypothetical protein